VKSRAVDQLLIEIADDVTARRGVPGEGDSMVISQARAYQMRELAARSGSLMAVAPGEHSAELAAHHDELSEAVRSFITADDAVAAVDMVADLRGYWANGEHAELARDLFDAALAMEGAPLVPRYAEAMVWRARFVFSVGGAADKAYALALDAARAADDQVSQVEALVGLGRVAARDGRWDDLRSVALEALELAKATGDGAHQRAPVHALAAAARMTGDLDEARRRYQESIEIGNALGMVSHAGPEYHNLGYVELHSGNLPEAERMFGLALTEARRHAMTHQLPYSVLAFAALSVARGEFERAAVLTATAMSYLEESGTALDPDDQQEYESVVRTLRDQLGADRMEALTREGQGLSPDAVFDLLGVERW
jgi:tetratricopeptide (TPR) repeat protein